jgi:rhamnulokinase
VTAQYLAFDLGAESGRAMLGRLQGGVLDIREIHRFPNQPLQDHGSLRWNMPALWEEMRQALDRAADARPESIGVDTWGCDFGLVDREGALVENPYHYRDARTDGVMARVFERVPADEIYGITGIQFLPFNTLYQLVAACETTPTAVDSAASLATIPDLFNLNLTGILAAELTNATTTQFVNARERTWAVDLLSRLDLPVRLLPRLIEPGTVLGPLRSAASSTLAGTPVVVPACHDTGSAVAAVPASGARAFLSSGTWSLLGLEVPAPVITPRSLALNFTNEGGVCGTTRLLKNIAGLWLLQACRRSWSEAGEDYDYAALLDRAEQHRDSFVSLIDPDHPSLLHPPSMPAAIAHYCRETDQPAPADPGACTRAILESLAFKYRVVLDALEELIGHAITEIHIVGGGSRNRLLNQFAADATGRTVIAGPVEATALGNLAMQMVATAAVASLSDARTIIERSFPIERFQPRAHDRWEPHFRRFKQYLELTCV